MGNVLINESTMIAIADMIRTKSGKTDGILPANMPTEIQENTESFNKYISLFDNTATSFKDDRITTISTIALGGNSNLTSVELPYVTELGYGSFYRDTNLTSVKLPICTSIGQACFQTCSNLKRLDLPCVTYIGNSAFNGAKLDTLVLRSTSMVTLAHKNAFTNTLINSGYGYIYVPSDLISTYKANSLWSAFNFRAIEDYSEICDAINTDSPVYMITNNLTNITSSNNTIYVTEGSSFTTALTINGEYEKIEVTIKMAGTDITDSVYSNGTITIDSVTGYIEITASAYNRSLIYNWDLTTSEVDTINNTAITLSSATRDESGLSLNAITDYATIPGIATGNVCMEFDISAMSRTGTSHGRLIMLDSDSGFIFRNTSYWQIYTNYGAWSNTTISRDSALFVGKTLVIDQTIGTDGCYYWKISVDDTVVVPNVKVSDTMSDIMLGSSGGQSFYSVTFTGIRVYEKV